MHNEAGYRKVSAYHSGVITADARVRGPSFRIYYRLTWFDIVFFGTVPYIHQAKVINTRIIIVYKFE